MKVIELARAAEVEAHLVRYYSRVGLLKPRRDPDNGYKHFQPSDVARLSFIRQAQELGFTLAEIREIVDHAAHGESPCHGVRLIIQTRIAENRKRLRELMALQERMESALKLWEKMPNGEPDGDSICILIESIMDGTNSKA